MHVFFAGRVRRHVTEYFHQKALGTAICTASAKGELFPANGVSKTAVLEYQMKIP